MAVPTLVMHGEADPLITVSGGIATAKAIPGAELITFPGIGHDMPEALWPQLSTRSPASRRRESRRAADRPAAGLHLLLQ